MAVHLEYGERAGDWRDRYDDRVDCNSCRQLVWRLEEVKLPPMDERLDPRQNYRTTEERRPRCRAGYCPMPGRLRRCPGYEEKRDPQPR